MVLNTLCPSNSPALAGDSVDRDFYCLAIIGLLLFTRLIIADVAGSHYWMFQTSAILAVLFTVVTLARARRSLDLFIRAKATNLLLAFLPLFLFAVCVIIAMQMGVKINAVGISPNSRRKKLLAQFRHIPEPR